MVTKSRRTLLIGLGAMGLGLLLSLAALPLWFPWVLRPLLPKYGVEFGSYERQGYGRVALLGVSYTTGIVRFKADRIETFLPTTWLWHRYTGGKKAEGIFIELKGWELELVKSRRGPDGENPPSGSVYETIQEMENHLEVLRSLLPKAILTNGVVRYAGEKVNLPIVTWEKGLIASRLQTEYVQNIFLRARLSTNYPWELSVKVDPLEIDSQILLTKNPTSVRIATATRWQTNAIEAAAQFGRAGWLPERANVRANSFRLPATMWKLKEYEALTGSLSVEWEQNNFTIDVLARGQPEAPEREFLPAVEAILHATGDTQSIRIATAKVSSPWLNASVSKEVEISFRGGLLNKEVILRVDADLANQPWLTLRGNLTGSAVLRPGTGKYPDITFSFSGQEVGGFGLRTEAVSLNGGLTWPWLQMDRAEVRFTDGSEASAKARLNLESGSVADGSLTLKGSSGQNFLPAGYSYRDLSLSVEFNGPLQKLNHAGRLAVTDLTSPQLVPMNVESSWRGEYLGIESFETKMLTEKAALAIAGSGRIGSEEIGLEFKTLDLSKAQEKAVLTLAKPTQIVLQKEKANGVDASPSWVARVEQFQWRGPGGELSLNGSLKWPSKGVVQASARDLSVALIQDFFVESLPNFSLDQFHFTGGWTNGPVSFNLGLVGAFTFPENSSFTASLNCTGGGSGLSLPLVVVSGNSGPVISGEGFLPVIIEPNRRENPVRIATNQPLDFHAVTKPNEPFWKQIARWTDIALREPELDLVLKGSLDSPQGKVDLRVERMEWTGPGRKLPALENIRAKIELDRQRLRLDTFDALVQGQPVSGSGEIPFPKDLQAGWKEVLQWTNATARVKIEKAEISPFAEFFPQILSPQGKVDLEVAISAGPQWEGALTIDGVATRPMMPMGPLHDVGGRLKFAGRQIVIEKLSGSLGGELTTLSGQIDLTKEKFKAGLPLINLVISGKNIPLVRQPELILRSDLNLSISNLTNDLVTVSGTANLRESFLLSDVKALIPGKVASPARRPPYFTIDLEPLSGWILNLKATGDRFLRVRTPFFRGEVSANLKLEGTLKEPVALGQTTIESGIVTFPFGTLRVEQGLVTLSSENPYEPQLSVTASSRTFGYEVKMDVTGPAAKPVIQFSSTPALSSEQIVLMLTAGELPRNELTFSTQQKAARLGLFLGKNLFSKLSPAMGEERFTLRSGETISHTGRETYSLEYKLNDDWSLVGEYDRFNDFNAGVKWRIYSR